MTFEIYLLIKISKIKSNYSIHRKNVQHLVLFLNVKENWANLPEKKLRLLQYLGHHENILTILS